MEGGRGAKGTVVAERAVAVEELGGEAKDWVAAAEVALGAAARAVAVMALVVAAKVEVMTVVAD